MRKAESTAESRTRLDDRFNKWGNIHDYAVPVRGWIKAIREALGMTTKQLADRMHVKQPSIVAMEQSEEKGSIELATLRRVAEALDCQLIYALVPNKPLKTIVRDRARLFIRHRRAPIEHSMLLEDQRVAVDVDIDKVIRETNPRLFWD